VENGIKAVSVSQQGGGKWRAVILERTYTAKPPAMQKTGGFAFSPYDVSWERTLSGGVEPGAS
jgi:hypothetical protein